MTLGNPLPSSPLNEKWYLSKEKREKRSDTRGKNNEIESPRVRADV